MTPGARLSAAIEIVDAIITSARQEGASADRIIGDYFKARRYAGSKDRRAVREYVWQAVRRFGEIPESGRAAFVALADEQPEIAALFDGEGHSPAPISATEARSGGGAVPEWIKSRLERPEVGIDLSALLDRAPLDIRVNALKAERDKMATFWPEAEMLRDVPNGLRLPSGTPVEASQQWCEGLVEVQDHGSQLIVEACRAAPGMTVLDLCAGAGGKTLGLAAAMDGNGTLVASDSDKGRLSRLRPRAERAGAAFIESRLLNPGRELDSLSDLIALSDVVLVDAPCSGTGTWRRNPETRWRLTAKRLDRLVEQQSRILDVAAQLVRPGGALVYAVCALTEQEGSRQIVNFLKRHEGYSGANDPLTFGRAAGQGRLLTPGYDGSDGFFVARLEKAA